MLFICNENSLRILQARCQSPASPSTDQSFVKELAKPTQDKIVFKNFQRFKKNKKRNAQPTNYHQTVTAKHYVNNHLTSTEDRRPAYNSP